MIFGIAKFQVKIKHKLTSLAALLFVIYALADVSVLQAYCGNEAVGIPSAHHVSNSEREKGKENQKFASGRSESDEKSRQNDVPSQDCPDEACFCCCSHVIPGFFVLPSTKITCISRECRQDSYTSGYATSSLTYFFRPPRIS